MIKIPKDYDLKNSRRLLKEILRNKTYSGINVESITKESKPSQNIDSYQTKHQKDRQYKKNYHKRRFCCLEIPLSLIIITEAIAMNTTCNTSNAIEMSSKGAANP